MLHIYIYDISSLRVNNLTLILLTWRKCLAPNNASKQQMGFNSAFKVLIHKLHMFVVSVAKKGAIHIMLLVETDKQLKRTGTLQK